MSFSDLTISRYLSSNEKPYHISWRTGTIHICFQLRHPVESSKTVVAELIKAGLNAVDADSVAVALAKLGVETLADLAHVEDK